MTPSGRCNRRTPDPAGAIHSFLISVSCPAAKSCIAVGFLTNGSGNQTPFAEHWNGTNWVVKNTPSPPLDPATQLNSVSCTSPTSCEAVGTSTTGTWAEVWNGDRIVTYGHTPRREPKVDRRAIGLDTGCVYGFNLSAYIIETDEFVSVPAQRAYDSS